MSGSAGIDLSDHHRKLVQGILAAQLPRVAWVFGSRASGRARPLSELDLAIDAGRRLNLDEIASLAEAFSDSDLPYKVDIVDWHAIDVRFQQIICSERQELKSAAG